MFLPLSDGLMPSNRGDAELAMLADRHYSRRTIGSKQFTGPGSDLVLRNAAGSVVFVWMYHNRSGEQLERWDSQTGYCCSMFRNESTRIASDIIREAESIVTATWGVNRFYTYVDPKKVDPTMFRGFPVWGWCFYKAGWSFVKTTKDGKHLLEKPPSADEVDPVAKGQP